MDEFPCKKTGICTRCGKCCHIRDKAIFDDVEDYSFRKSIYQKTGVVYIYKMSRYTMSISTEEKERLEAIAKERNITYTVLPKKIMIVNGEVQVLDWFVDHDVCPFFEEEEKHCSIYKQRPAVCIRFPLPYKITMFVDPRKYDDGNLINFDDALSKCKADFSL